MKTRCKFKCDSVTLMSGDGKSAILSPVVSNDKDSENSKFWKYTPSGKLELMWINPDVNFVPGKEYYLDITLAEPEI